MTATAGRATRTDAMAIASAPERDWREKPSKELEALRQENQQLRELVIQLSRLVVKRVMDQK